MKSLSEKQMKSCGKINEKILWNLKERKKIFQLEKRKKTEWKIFEVKWLRKEVTVPMMVVVLLSRWQWFIDFFLHKPIEHFHNFGVTILKSLKTTDM